MKLFIFFFLAFASFMQAQHVIIGRDVLPINGEIVIDTFLFFDKNKGAFRGGWLAESQKWAPDSVGLGSFAYGVNVKASGISSFALGTETIASGNYSLTSGFRNTASGYNSFALGTETIASGNYSYSSGYLTTASGNYSYTSGSRTVASGYNSFSSGNQTTASGYASFASGYKTIALGNSSFVSGNQTVAPSYTEFSIGSFNSAYTPINNYQWNLNDRLFVIGNGTAENSRSDAMVVLKNGDVSFPDGNFIVGRDAVPSNGETVTDGMLFYDDAKYALRGGRLNSSKNWAPDSIGSASFAYGYNVKAIANYSFALGINSVASGLVSFASGYQTTASGNYSFSSGYQTTASGNYSFASGSGTTSSSSGSFASGSTTVASGLVSFASGSGTTASGNYSFASGQGSQASGDYSFSSGSINIASGNYSFAAGQRTFAPSYAEFSIGSYNTDYTPNDTEAWNANDRLFVIGNGTDLLRSDAMVVLKNGNTGIGTSTPDETLHIVGDLKIEGESNSATLNMKTADGTTNRIMVMQNNGADLIFGDIDGKNQHVYFKSGGLNRMIINNAGNVGIGTSSPSYQLQLSQNSAAKPGSTAWTIYSDKRLKQNIHKYTDGLAQILAINPVTFQYNDASGFDVNKEYVGIIAQELQGIAPYMVNEKKDGYLTVDNGAMTYMLINAVKEQSDLIKKQQEVIDLNQKEILSLKSGKVQSEDRFRSLEAKLDALISDIGQKQQG